MPFRSMIADKIAPLVGMEANAVVSLMEIPPDPAMGDYALPCFAFAKTMRKNPMMIAQSIAEAPQADCVTGVEAVKGYVNFTVDKQLYAKTVLNAVQAQGDKYGAEDVGHGRTVCIDYSSINIAKPFHIGHLSSTAIGHALYNLYNFMGYRSVGINHLGDWGTQFGKLLAAYELWGNGMDIEQAGVEGMLKLYVKFHAEAEADDSLNDLGRQWFRRIEDNDPEAMDLFVRFKDTTIKEVMHVYDMLGITFDSYAGESFYNDKMEPVIEELREKGLLTESNGAQVVDLEPYGMPPCLVLKSDGATLYATRDMAAAFYRKHTYDFAKCLYVVAYQQNLHFRQWFKTVELMGHDWAADLEHVAFGMVSLADGGTLSTRKGNVVRLEDVLLSAVERARMILDEKSPNIENKDEVARKVGIGAVVFGVLYNARIKDIAFSYDRVLSFEGETAPYVQYTYARTNSLLQKAADVMNETPDFSALENEFAFAVLRSIARFPETLKAAMEKNEPYLIARNVVELAQAYNRFYYEVRILDDDKAASAARVGLSAAANTVLHTGLTLLGVAAPERM
ncbi:MAG: arginine--tRNA ligase [Clostridia bacterium]|nr:arginine--tRNA ligase [Clostridia bacterium]